MNERWAVTGAHGCIGAWTVAELVRGGKDVVALDWAPGRGRTELLLDDDELNRVDFRQVDIVEPFALDRVTHVVHLAALTYPYCHDDHATGAYVNVVGTTNVFDAAANAGAKLVFASSIAALGQVSLYGAWKRANEDTARAFWAEDGFASIGIRPALVYGVGRDRGVTASMTLAMHAAAQGEPYHIVHGGSSPLNHAADIASVFIRSAQAVGDGVAVYNAGGEKHDMREVIAAIKAAVPDAQVTYDEEPFGEVSPDFSGDALAETLGEVNWRPLDLGVRETIEHFRALGG